MSTPLPALSLPPQRSDTAFRVLGAISVSHLINDMMQSLILAIYPILKGDFQLSFGQIGLITLTLSIDRVAVPAPGRVCTPTAARRRIRCRSA